MRESGVCVKYPLEEATNVTRYSWFERSNLVAYEPGMRRRLSQDSSMLQSAGDVHNENAPNLQNDGIGLSPGPSATQREESSAVNGAGSRGGYRVEGNGERDGQLDQNATSSKLPTVLVEHRWSFLFSRSSRTGKSPSAPLFEKKASDSGTPGAKATDVAPLRPLGKPNKQTGNEEDPSSADDDSDSSKHKVTTVQAAFNSPGFGGRSSVLRCLVMDLELRFVARTQMNYSFHLSAISERVVHEGVYHIVNFTRGWNPVITNEPIDMDCVLRLLQVLDDVVRDSVMEKQEQSEGTADKEQDEPARKFQKVAGDSAFESHARSASVSGNVAAQNSSADRDGEGRSTMHIGAEPLSNTIPTDATRTDTPKPSTLGSVFLSLSSARGRLLQGSRAAASGQFDAEDRLFALIRRSSGVDCSDALISGVVDSLICAYTNEGGVKGTGGFVRRHVRVERRLVQFEQPPRPLSSDADGGHPAAYCDGSEAVERMCLCCSKYAVCPTVFNEYIIFGGTPAIPPDMELGLWIFDSPFTRVKMRDVPVVYHQQVQYSTKKYITVADLNDAILSTRVLNLRMEFCGRGDWVFDDGTLPLNETDKARTIYGKVVSADDLMQLEFSGTVNQIAKKFFVLQKAFLSTGKEGTSRLIFMDPYANIDASICDDKDYVDHLIDLLTVMYKESPGNFLASCNGYYYHEDGFLPESIDVQRLRNTLFNLESSHYRTAMLADIVSDQKHVLGLSQKMPFLTKCKRVMIGKSRIHGYGLFAVDNINKGDLILEYAGVVISDHMADIRETIYDRLLCGSIYMFRLDLNHIIDSTFYGNCARFINHSCDPNTATTNFSYIDEDGFGAHVGIYASKVIPAGEEIYYNYRLSAGSANREVCHCGSYMCTGYMSLVK
ncbi:SET domain-containing protein [Babesia ovata]|uniref:SET domain-containing protein n=1 Tax=Babesia ovata TaxID=189622 RepID=A0A2H6K7K4_9APIC|nr:SET domain-containing protein [Babesia ovata]GBE58977.1 SET domain-containing protein [Babesia ovata]